MKLSIAIPAYNRPEELKEVLESLASQCKSDVEIVVCEDCSPKATEIKAVVESFQLRNPQLEVHYHSNPENLGYDANLRRLVEITRGEYVFFLGDDDIIPSGALARVKTAIEVPGVGVVLRAWRAFDSVSGEIIKEHRYFQGDRIFEAGTGAVVAFFRRSVFISGLTVHRKDALRLSTDRFDGTLLYQLHIVGNILKTKHGYYIDDFVAERRTGGQHYFGSSKRERGYEAGKTEAAHSERFVAGMLSIADTLDEDGSKVSKLIRNEISTYSFSLLETQACRIRLPHFFNYGIGLVRLGLGRNLFFWVYFFSLTLFGARFCNLVISLMYRALNRTPVLIGEVGRRV